jgi:hypothetical protein
MNVDDHLVIPLESQIRRFHAAILQEPASRVFENNAPVFQNISAVRDIENVLDILLDQKNSDRRAAG